MFKFRQKYLCVLFAVMMFFVIASGGCGGGSNSSSNRSDKEEYTPSEPTYFTVTFDSKGGSNVKSQIVPAYTNAERPIDPEAEDKVFLGWVDEYDDAFDFDDRIIYYDITLSARWGEILPLDEEEHELITMSTDIAGEVSVSFDNSPLLSIDVHYVMSGTGTVIIKSITDTPLLEVPGRVGDVLSFTNAYQDEFANLQEATITFKCAPDLLQEYAENLCAEYSSESFDVSIDEIDINNLAVLWYDESNDIVDFLGSTSVDIENFTVTVKTTHFCNIFLALRDIYDWFINSRLPAVRTDSSPYYSVVLAMDCSGSMSGSNMEQSINAANGLVDILADDDYISVIAFSSSARTVFNPLRAGDNRDTVKQYISSLRASGSTNMSAALNLAKDYSSHDNRYQSIVILLSDGYADFPVSESLLDELKSNNQKVVTVGIGRSVDTNLMKNISDKTGGSYLYAEKASDLKDAFMDLQNTYIGSTKDTDKDGLPDLVEVSGMRDQYGKIWRTNPSVADSDGDGKSDSAEMGDYQALAATTHFKRKSNPNMYTVENHQSLTVLPEEMYLTVKADNTVIAQADMYSCRYQVINGIEYIYSPADKITVNLIKYPPTMNLLSGWPKLQEEDNDSDFKHYIISARLSYSKNMIFDPAIWEINVDGKKHQVNLGGIWHLIFYTSRNPLYTKGTDAIETVENKFMEKLRLAFPDSTAKDVNEEPPSSQIEKIKKQIVVSEITLSNIPDEGDYKEAFARAILGGVADFRNDSENNSNFSNPEEMSRFIAVYLPKGKNVSVIVKNRAYNVRYTMSTGAFATAEVSSAGRRSVSLAWSVQPEEARGICNNYLDTLNKIKDKAWKNFQDTVRNEVIKASGTLVSSFLVSLCDDPAEEAMNELLKSFRKNMKPADDAIDEAMNKLIGNAEIFVKNLKECVRDSVTNAQAFINTANKIKKAKGELEKFGDALCDYNSKKSISSKAAQEAEKKNAEAWGSFKSAYDDISNKGFWGDGSIFEDKDNLPSLEKYYSSSSENL